MFFGRFLTYKFPLRQTDYAFLRFAAITFNIFLEQDVIQMCS